MPSRTPADETPLVSCVLVTRNRPQFVPQALRCFRRQTYPNRELIVVDDSDRSQERLWTRSRKVRYIRIGSFTPSGTKLNIGVHAARGGIIQILDDDDYYGPEFLAGSVSRLPRSQTTVVARCCFLVLLRGRRELRHSGHGWNPSSICFHRALWEKRPYRDLNQSSDSWFLRDHQPRIVRVCDIEQYMVVRHGANTWNTIDYGSADEYFAACEAYSKQIGQLFRGEEARFYRSIAVGV